MAKRKMNAYFTKMTKARKSGAKSFVYNGKRYVARKSKTGMLIYKRTVTGNVLSRFSNPARNR